MREVLCSGQELEDEVWERVILEVDYDGNGEIEFDEFSKMMRKMVR